MKTLIIPDIHNDVDTATHILKRESYDTVVFLGDYFDDFDDNPAIAKRTAEWLKDKLNRKNYIFLIGNHDLPYMWPEEPEFRCSGFTWLKAYTINNVLTRADWAKLKLYACTNDGFLLSHAGLDNNLSMSLEPSSLSYQCIKDPLLLAGRDRGGSEKIGGILWCDFNSITPNRYPQIVGHTYAPVPRVKHNITCLDTKLQHYGILCNGILKIKTRL